MVACDSETEPGLHCCMVYGLEPSCAFCVLPSSGQSPVHPLFLSIGGLVLLPPPQVIDPKSEEVGDGIYRWVSLAPAGCVILHVVGSAGHRQLCEPDVTLTLWCPPGIRCLPVLEAKI